MKVLTRNLNGMHICPGVKVKVPGFNIDLVLVKNIDGLYALTELTTGYSISSPKDNKKDAISIGVEKLKEVGQMNALLRISRIQSLHELFN